MALVKSSGVHLLLGLYFAVRWDLGVKSIVPIERILFGDMYLILLVEKLLHEPV